MGQRIKELLEAPACTIMRDRPKQRVIDLKPYLDDLRLASGSLEMDLLVTPNGTARPDEILTLLGLAELVDEGELIERITLELEDEMPMALPAALP